MSTGTKRRTGFDDRGSATIWVLACSILLTVVAAVAVVRGLAVLARHRAEDAADLAALAAATRIGAGGGQCDAAARIALANGARLRSCHLALAPDGRSGTVRLQAAVAVSLPLVGARTVVASAVAGRAPARPASARLVGRGAAQPSIVAPFAGRPPAVTSAVRLWHAGAGCLSRSMIVPIMTGVATGTRTNGATAVDVSVSRSSDGDIPVVAVSGEVDVYSAPALKDSLTGLLQSGATTVIVDLTEVAFLDSTGLGALVEARAAISEAGGSLPLVCNQERILKLFTITGLDGVFALHPSIEAAVAALHA